MEGDKVRVVDDGSGDGHQPWNPARSWWVVAVTGAGLIGAGVVLGWALGSSSGPSGDAAGTTPAAASTTAPTITTVQPNSTTTTPTTTTTTTVWWGATDAAASIRAEVQNVCERASPAGVDGLQTPDEWVESLFIDDEWMYNYLESLIYPHLQQARLDQNARLADSLALVAEHIDEAETATDDLLHRWDARGSDEWTNLVALAERHCAAASATIETMMAMSSE